ncbi:hypothetical protein OS493_032217 [Desmophyllum pertusum]|uniref:Uncharacterized protein n=1 Tax=Desmophyllum pertusum TaxID=174260 RepID=A0A9W9ZXK4_9CNID|nr:hypothetical protein OS493_032217 [Desmophyllum pertusum]
MMALASEMILNYRALQVKSRLTASPFTDSNGRITEYEMCVGTEQEKCDVSDFVTLGNTLKGTITGLSLNHTGRYFVTVRATNEAGYSTMATSNGVRVDSTPPVGGEVRDGQTLADIDYQASGAHIYANWDEFQDVESEVIRVSSDGVKVDSTAPVISKVLDLQLGSPLSIKTTSPTRTLTVSAGKQWILKAT